jgi:hypothetical protein
MNYYFFLLGFFCTKLLTAQTNDYLSIRDSILIAHCGVPNHETLHQERVSLERINVQELGKNQYLYYKDLGWNYYQDFILCSDTSLLLMAVESFDASLNFNKSESTVLWNSGMCWFLLGDCGKAMDLLSRYQACTPRKIWDKNQINWMILNCAEKSDN